jgi:tetratricopeptide (TPR) repeat protein
MKVKFHSTLFLLPLFLLLLLFNGTALAQSELPTESPAPVIQRPVASSNSSFWDKLDLLRQDRQLQQLVEEDLEKSIAIRSQIQTEVDRAFEHTTTLLNVLIGVLTFLPVLAAISIWFIRRSVLNQIIMETKKQLQEEVSKQLEADVAEEMRKQAADFQAEIDSLKAEFQLQLSQLKSLFSDTQKEKDRIIQELSRITPSPVREVTTPEEQQKIQALTKQLEQLQSANAQLSFSPNDYIEQGKALYFEGRYEAAIASLERALQLEPDNPKAWLTRGAALAKLQQFEAANTAYDTAIQLKPELSEAWFGKGVALAKLQQMEAAITAYEKAIALKPDFSLAWFFHARCYAALGNLEATISSLHQAIQLNPEKCRDAAKTDTAFEPLRKNEQFRQLIDSF